LAIKFQAVAQKMANNFRAGPTTYGKVEANCLHFESGGRDLHVPGGHKVPQNATEIFFH